MSHLYRCLRKRGAEPPGNLREVWPRLGPWGRSVFGSEGEWWGQQPLLKQSEAENGLFLISIHLLVISLFIFAFFFQGHPLPFGGSVIFFFFWPVQLFLISQNHRVVCSSVTFYVPAFPFSVSLSVFTCLLFPSVFLPWYIFLLQLFSNTCSALLILNFPNGSFYSYHFSA